MDLTALLEHFLSHPDVTIDTRDVREGSVFFALKGERFDGNQFAPLALEKGASLAVVSDPSLKGSAYFHVPDTLEALQQLGRMYRDYFSVPVLGITGSNGKTTTKELITSVLAAQYRVHATAGNLNNHIGVPITMLRTPIDTEIIICEMGANHIGEIASLCTISRPTHALITNIGRAHLEGFGSVEGVKKAKGELYAYAREHDGFAFVNADDPNVYELGIKVKKHLLYSLQDQTTADLQFRYRSAANAEGFSVADLHSDIEIHSQLFGAYNAINVLAAYAVGFHFGVEQTGMLQAIASFQSKINRSEVVQLHGCTILKDAYNANPSSMELAIKAFGEKYPYGWLVIGDMKELGAESEKAHAEMIALARQFSFERIYLVGPEFAHALRNVDVKAQNVYAVPDVDFLKTTWDWKACNGKSILLKGSRSMHLESLLS